MKNVTFCLMTCGEETEEECLKAIEPFRDKVVVQEVRNVYPQIKALNQMINQVETEYFVPLDADIILDRRAYRRINRAIEYNKDNSSWHSILFPLYDTLTERKILALKLLRSKVMKEHPFKESATPDVEHFTRLTEAGYSCVDAYLNEKPIGNHVVRGGYFCYHKYRDVYLTLRSHGWEWDSGVFMGGKTIREKSKKHFDFFIKQWLLKENEDYLYCIAGMLDGLTSPVDHKSKSLERKKLRFKFEYAVDQYLKWYFIDSVPDSYIF